VLYHYHLKKNIILPHQLMAYPIIYRVSTCFNPSKVVPGVFSTFLPKKTGRGNGPAACGSSKNTRGERPSGRRRMAGIQKKHGHPGINPRIYEILSH
jgi:hypothetical protein